MDSTITHTTAPSTLDEFLEQARDRFFSKAQARYGSVMAERWRDPRHAYAIENPDVAVTSTGASGDSMTVFLRLDPARERIEEASCLTNGCGPTLVAGDAVCELAQGRRLEEAKDVTSADVLDMLGGLPGDKVHCVDLAVEAMRCAANQAL
jgi:NifU-like protein involved in Fe-S cluster formation